MQVQTNLRPQLEEQHGPALLGTQYAPSEQADGNLHHWEAKPPDLTGPAQSYTATKEGYRRLYGKGLLRTKHGGKRQTSRPELSEPQSEGMG